MKTAKETSNKNSQESSNTKDSSSANPVPVAYEQLQKALENISTNESWLEYLAFQSKFYNYSFSNTLLIYSQNPGASYVAGYKKWQSFNRYVRKSEHGIKILAPMRYKVKGEENDDDVFKIGGFRLVSVFDISQTDGSDEFLPVLVGGLKTSVIGESDIYNNIINRIDIPVKEVDQLTAKGCYYLENPRIEVRSSLSVVQKIKTLCHEYSHHLHHTKHYDDEGYAIGEIIAESSAYIVCSYLGIDTSDYSIGYVKSWCKDLDVLQSTASKIQKISSEIIQLINESPASTASIAEL
jgi:hypothetical protein